MSFIKHMLIACLMYSDIVFAGSMHVADDGVNVAELPIEGSVCHSNESISSGSLPCVADRK
jgi:hypothetical protein